MKEVLSKIKPTNEEKKKFQSSVSSFLKKLNKELKDAKAVLGGSGAKDTYLSGSCDIDIFVLYPLKKYSPKTHDLSNFLEKVLKKSFPHITLSRLHGSRDYFQLFYEGYLIEVIPILKISKASYALNITDISPLHTKWVNAHAKKCKDDIRLVKQFCKAQGVYGAESYIGGFSGYVLEILVVAYGSFPKLLKASAHWKLKDVIDVAKHYPKKDALFHLNQSKTQSPLIVIDPVDKSRNAAAALSSEKLSLFCKKAKEFLQKPSLSFFEKRDFSLAKLQERTKKLKKHLIYIELKPHEGKEDVIGAKLAQAFHSLNSELEQFVVVESGWDFGKQKTIFYFIVKDHQLPAYEIRKGPPLSMVEFVEAFKKKNKNTYVEKGILYAKIARKETTLPLVVKKALTNSYISARIQKVIKIETSS